MISPTPTILEPGEAVLRSPWALADVQGQWHVLHTKSRQEKVLAADLAAMGIAHYLPLVRQTRQHGGRKVVVDEPIFAGYVFLRGTLDQAYLADRTRRVAGIIRVADQKQLEWELTNLYFALTCEAPLAPFPFLQKGVRVEVKSGPFRGLQGVIEDRLSNDRLILQVAILGRGVSLEIDGAVLEPL